MPQQPIVLIVDDDVEVAELTCDIVERCGVDAVYRTNVLDAIDFLARHAERVVAVLTDINLATPLSGVDLAVHVDTEWPAAAVCVVSGMTATRPARLPQRAIFLAKPWRGDDLVAFVDAAVRR